MSKAPKASMVPYPVWAFEVPVTATADLVSGQEITSVNATADLLLQAVEAFLKMPSGGSPSPLDGVLLGRRPGQGGVDTALPKLTGPSSGSASASASKDVVSVVLIFANEGRPRQVVVRTLSALVSKLLSSALRAAIEAVKAHCTHSLRSLTIASLVHGLADTIIINACWSKTLTTITPSLRAGGAASLQAYLLGRHETGAHTGSADPVATAGFHLRLGLDMLGPREYCAPWASSSGSSSGSKRAPLVLLLQGEGGGKKAREAPEAAPPAPATNPNQNSEPPASAEHSNIQRTATNPLAELLSWEGALTGPTAAERALEILQFVVGVTDENARLKLELESYKAQDALRAKVSLAR